MTGLPRQSVSVTGRLLELYEILFGQQLETVTHCPRCDESLEVSLATHDIVCRHPIERPANRSSCVHAAAQSTIVCQTAMTCWKSWQRITTPTKRKLNCFGAA